MLNITKGKIDRAQKVVIYGSEGIGKSGLAAKFPDPLFIDTEGGTAHMDVRRIEKPQSWEEMLSVVKEVAAAKDVCRTLVLDTADWAEQLIVSYLCTKYKQNSIESFGYGKGYTYLGEEFSRLLGALDTVLASGVHVVITAHAKMRKFEQPDEMDAYDRWEMKLSKQVAPLLKELDYKHIAHIFSRGQTPAATTATQTAPQQQNLPEEESAVDVFRSILKEKGVTEEEVRQVVAARGKYSVETPIDDYPDEFLYGYVIRYWDQIFDIIQQNRKAKG